MVDDIIARVSVSDIFLAQSVMTRRGLLDREEPPPLAAKPQPLPLAAPSQSTELRDDESGSSIVAVDNLPAPLSPSAASKYTVTLDMGAISLVGINDFRGQNIPVIRYLLAETTFNAEGTGQEMYGEGSFVACADFYNPKLSLWEPVLDQWNPKISLSSGPSGNSVEVTSQLCMSLLLA